MEIPFSNPIPKPKLYCIRLQIPYRILNDNSKILIHLEYSDTIQIRISYILKKTLTKCINKALLNIDDVRNGNY